MLNVVLQVHVQQFNICSNRVKAWCTQGLICNSLVNKFKISPLMRLALMTLSTIKSKLVATSKADACDVPQQGFRDQFNFFKRNYAQTGQDTRVRQPMCNVLSLSLVC